jgi:hypothetical protein
MRRNRARRIFHAACTRLTERIHRRDNDEHDHCDQQRVFSRILARFLPPEPLEECPHNSAFDSRGLEQRIPRTAFNLYSPFSRELQPAEYMTSILIHLASVSRLRFLGGRSFSSDIVTVRRRLRFAAPFPRAFELGAPKLGRDQHLGTNRIRSGLSVFGRFVFGRVMLWFRVVYAALMRIFLLVMKPLRGSARRGGLRNDRRQKRQSQNQRRDRSSEFHVRPPSRPLNKKLQ